MKGIGIILVMLGHTHTFYGGCLMPNWFLHGIESFHVPLFFLIAGYFSKPYSADTWKQSIQKSFDRLVIPYLIVAGVIIVYNLFIAIKRQAFEPWYALVWSYLIDDASNRFADSLNLPLDMGVGPIWFLIALWWSKTIFLFISRTRKHYIWICVVISFATVYLSKLFPLPFGLWQGLTALGFVSIGYWCRHNIVPLWLKIICIVSWVVALAVTSVSPYASSYPIYPLNLLGACGGTYCVYLVSLLIKKIPFVTALLTKFGERTMEILSLHTIDMRCNAIRQLLKHTMHSIYFTYPWICLIIEYVISLVCAFSVAYIKDRKQNL